LVHPRWHSPVWATKKCRPDRTAIKERGVGVLRAVSRKPKFGVGQKRPPQFVFLERGLRPFP